VLREVLALEPSGSTSASSPALAIPSEFSEVSSPAAVSGRPAVERRARRCWALALRACFSCWIRSIRSFSRAIPAGARNTTTVSSLCKEERDSKRRLVAHAS